MAGGLLQLLSFGYADKVLIGNPQMTFFKKVYHKYSLFAIQDHQLLSESDITFGSSTNFKIRNYGDLFFSPYLKIDLPGIKVSYDKTLNDYVELFDNYKYVETSNTNLIISKLNAILFNYNPTKFPVGNNDIFNYCYDHIQIPSIKIDNVIKLYDVSYNQMFELDSNASFYEKYVSDHIVSGNTDIKTQRNIYFSTFNVNYLTTILNLFDLPNKSIVVDDDIFQNFKNTLYKFIANNYENEFLYAIIKSYDIFESDFSHKNREFTITNEIDYIQNYFYTNMNIIYVYRPDSIDNSVQLKYVGFIDDYIYSGNNFTNVVTPFNNLYDSFEIDISSGRKFYIASGYELNKKFNITKISSFAKSFDSYDISFNISEVGLDNNIVYFIYPDIKPIDQDIIGLNSTYPNYEDYFKIFYTDYLSAFKSDIYQSEKLLMPICMIKYNSDTGLFDKISLEKNVTPEDFIFIYNDVFIYNIQSQKNQFILINNKIFTINNTSVNISDNTYLYSSNLYIDSSGNPIDSTGLISIDGEESYLINSTSFSMEFIDHINDFNTFTVSTITSPYKIYYKITPGSFYFANRLCPVNFVKNSTINLDTYNNLEYNTTILNDVNIDINLKNSIAVNNISATIDENIIYITNILNSFLNLYIYFQQYNRFQLSSTTGNISLTISPVSNNNFLANILTSKNINGINNFYNQLQNIIQSNIENLSDIFDIQFTKLIRSIYNLKYNDSQIITQDTKFMYMLSNLSKSKYFLRINSLDNYNITYHTSDGSGTSTGRTKLYFKPSGFDPITDLNLNLGFGLEIQKEGSFYVINNVYIILTTSNSSGNFLPYYLLPQTFTDVKKFYLLMYLFNYTKSSGTELNEIYLTPIDYTYDSFTDPTGATIEPYKITILYTNLLNKLTSRIDSLYDSTDTNIILPTNDSVHYLPLYYNSLTEITSIVDVTNINYHYAYNLYMKIKDKINPTQLVSNNIANYFAIFNDKKMYENLWHIMQTNITNTKNASALAGTNNLVNINNLSTNYYYLTTSINFASYIDYEIINNSIITSIDEFFAIYIKSDMLNFLLDKKDYFNFFTVSTNIMLNLNSSNPDLDIDLINLIFIKQFYWYLNYLNAIISDINSGDVNYNSETLFNCKVEDFNQIKNFFDVSTNIFNTYGEYLGSVFNLNLTDYTKIIKINSLFNSVITYIISLLENQIITLEDDTINLYTKITIPTIYNNIIFDTVALGDLIYSLPVYYTHTYYLSYEFSDITNFHYNIKNVYIDKYKLILDEFINYGNFTNEYFSEIKQYLNFSIGEYEKSMKFFRKNPQYSENNDNLAQIITYAPIMIEPYYKFSIINSPSVYEESNVNTSNFISNYYTNKKTILNLTNDQFKLNINILDFLYEDVDNIISLFNSFFNTNYSFYSDYKIIYGFIIYFYDTFTFVYDSNTYILYLGNISDNTSTSNYIKNSTTGNIWNYSDICFIDSSTNKVRHTIKNGHFYDISENKIINYDYKYDLESQKDIIHIHSQSYYYIINNKIYNSSDKHIYSIKNQIIFDTSGTNVGLISEEIITIENITYVYVIDSTTKKRLYSYYAKIYPNQDGEYLIDGYYYKPVYNVFFDYSSKLLKFYFQIPEYEQFDLRFVLVDLTNNITPIDPLYIRTTLSKTQLPVLTNFSTVFKQVFSNENNSKTITYLNTDFRNYIGELGVSLNRNLSSQLLNNCIKNSIFPSKDLNDNIIICSFFNNYIHTTNIDWLVKLNLLKLSLGQIVILNKTDQTIDMIENFINANYVDKEFCFIPESRSFYPINSDGFIALASNSVENFIQLTTNNYDYMLTQSKYLKKLTLSNPLITMYLQEIKQKSTYVKNAIISRIINDISNDILDGEIYKPKTFFNFSTQNQTISFETNQMLIGPNSYFIYNANLITNDERNSIFSLDISGYNVVYDYKFFTFSLQNISTGSLYLITTNSEPLDALSISWDISSNGSYYLFDHSRNHVLVNISLNSSYSLYNQTLFIYQGKINRYDKMDFGFELDISLNLDYKFKYDLSLNILSKVVSKFNYGVFNDHLNSKYYVDQKTSITLYNTFIDFSTNCLTDISTYNIWSEVDLIEDLSAVYISIPNYSNSLNIPIDIFTKYIIINNTTTSTKTIFDIMYMIDISQIYLIKLHPIDKFVYDSDGIYELEMGIGNFINLMGTDLLNTGCIMYYWEKFYSGVDLAFDLLNDTLDTAFIDQKFTCKEYTEKIYQMISNITVEDNEYNSLFEIPECIFDKKVKYSINVFKDYDSTNAYYKDIIMVQNTTNNLIQTITNQINRPKTPSCSWINWLGHYIAESIAFKIDDNTIEELDDQIVHIYNFLNSTTSKDIELNRMIGNISDLTYPAEIIGPKIIYVPLPFFFKDPEKALPVISLLHSQLSVYVKLKPLNSLVILPNDQTSVKSLGKIKVKLCGSYVYLDTNERTKFAQMRHEYLVSIKQSYKYYINENKGSLNMDLKLPVSEIMWFYLDSSLKQSNIYWNYTGIYKKFYYSDNLFANTYNFDDDVVTFIKSITNGKASYLSNMLNIPIEDIQTNLSILSSEELDSIRNYIRLREINSNPFQITALDYNGYVRFKLEGGITNLVIPSLYYNDTVASGLNIYNFSRYPKANTHSGSLNFKFANNIKFIYLLDFADTHQANGEINIICKTLNVLRIASGIGCLAW